MSIVKWIIENNNGRIEVESEEGEGTSFTVWLPLSSTEDDETVT
ncbi:MAG: hypothetical protein U5K84_12530 [Alkalibacterium sp.]|nr:hypothetical protein [Alkalibacterium sp.]